MNRFLPWTVVHLSIRDRWPDLNVEAGIGGLFVVFWLDHLPLGQLMVQSELLPISAEQLGVAAATIIAPVVGRQLLAAGFEPPLPVPARKQMPSTPPILARLLELDRPLETLRRRVEHEASTSPAPLVSLVICTRNRPERLEQCLSSLRDLSASPNEIIVVDNDPSSGLTRPVMERFPEVRYIGEPRPGLSAARNTGLLACRSEIIAFTDDDVVVHAGWIGAIASAFRDPGVMAVTGLVLPAELATPAQFVFQSNGPDWGWGYRAVDFDSTLVTTMKGLGVPVWRLGAGANMAFRRSAFDLIGLFDERLGAGASGCSEDSEMWYRLLAEGYRVRYAPTAVVFHFHRRDWEGMCNQLHSYMRGHMSALFFQFERYGHWGNIYRAFIAVPWHLARITFHSAKRRVARLLSDSGSQAVSQPLAPQILGAIAGCGYYLQHRRRNAHVPDAHYRAPESPPLDAPR